MDLADLEVFHPRKVLREAKSRRHKMAFQRTPDLWIFGNRCEDNVSRQIVSSRISNLTEEYSTKIKISR